MVVSLLCVGIAAEKDPYQLTGFGLNVASWSLVGCQTHEVFDWLGFVI